MPMTDDVEDREQAPRAPTFYSIDKQLAVLSAEQRAFRTSVDKRFDTMERRVEEFGSAYATKLELAEVVKKIEKLEERHDKFVTSVSSYGKAIIVSFLAAVAGLVYKTGLLH